MADQSNNRGDIMDQRSGTSGGVDGNGIRQSGTNSGGVGGRGIATTGGGGGEGKSTSESVRRKKPPGFAAMDPQTQRAIPAKGGRAAHQKGTAHEFKSEETGVA